MNREPARIVFTCGREPQYQRNTIILDALRQSFDVVEVTEDSRRLLVRYLQLYWGLARALQKPIDLVVTGFLGQPLVPFIRRFTRAPILFDAFLSVYDTLSYERQTFKPDSLFGHLAYRLDKSSCESSNLVTLDTNEHVRYFAEKFHLSIQKLHRVFVGCSEKIFFPRPDHSVMPMILFYGSFLPLQGVDVIVQAARLLEKESPLRFRLIGEGPMKKQVCRFIKQMDLKNIDVFPSIPLSELPQHISQAMICLGGHFGRAEKARRVIAGKTYQMIAMGRPTIVGDNPANSELLTHGQDAWFCPMDSPEALASAIIYLYNDPDVRNNLSVNANRTFRSRSSQAVLFPIWQNLARSLLFSTPSQ